MGNWTVQAELLTIRDLSEVEVEDLLTQAVKRLQRISNAKDGYFTYCDEVK